MDLAQQAGAGDARQRAFQNRLELADLAIKSGNMDATLANQLRINQLGYDRIAATDERARLRRDIDERTHAARLQYESKSLGLRGTQQEETARGHNILEEGRKETVRYHGATEAHQKEVLDLQKKTALERENARKQRQQTMQE
jgi:hypothetical protein